MRFTTIHWTLPLLGKLTLAVAAVFAWALPAGAQVTEYYHLDGIGNVRVVTDQSGQVVERHDYLPFGEECTVGNCGTNPQVGGGQAKKFTGKERDTETGLDYFGARYYGSRIARFTSVDPGQMTAENFVDPQLWNRFAYAENNPLRYTDPDGERVVETVRTKSYDVQGATASEAAENARSASGIRSDEGERMPGSTSTTMTVSNLTWTGKSKVEGDGSVSSTVTLATADVVLTQTLKMPNWVGRGNAPPNEQAAWDNWLASLQRHENGHLKISRDGAATLDKQLPGTKGTGHAGSETMGLNAARNQAMRTIQAKQGQVERDTNARQKTYDKETNHGRSPSP